MTPPISKRLTAAQPSLTKAMTQRARALAATGMDVITLSQGELDFETPRNIRAAGVRAIKAGKTRYTEVAGIPELRTAIAARMQRDLGLAYEIDEITVGTGAKQVLFNALFAIADPGSEVVFPAPCWVSYPEMIALAGASPIAIDTQQSERWILTPTALRRALSPRTRALLLNSPCNPTGAVYRRDELLALSEVLRERPDIWVICDEIYSALTYTVRHVSLLEVAPDLRDRSLLIDGVSKAAAMTGWRVGYGVGPQTLIKAMNTFQSQTTSHATSISQFAALEALAGDQTYIGDFRAELKTRRDYLCDRLSQIKGLQVRPPEGAFYVYVDVSQLIGRTTPNGKKLESDMDVALYWLEAGVAGVPGIGFLASPFIRLSFAASERKLEAACDRIAQSCGALFAAHLRKSD